MNSKLFIPSVTVLTAFLVLTAYGNIDQVNNDLANVQLILQNAAVAPSSQSAIEIKFDVAKDWHFYADSPGTPEGMGLKIAPQAKGLTFSNPVFPQAQSYFDKSTNQQLSVYSGTFSVFISFSVDTNEPNTLINLAINGVACNGQLCKKASYELSKNLEISPKAQMSSPLFALPSQTSPPQQQQTNMQATTALIAMPLAILAGLLLNVMPCVWPILPIIVMRLVSQSQNDKAKSLIFGIAFAIGIIIFFAALAVLNIILKLGFGLVFQWGDQFRNPAFVTGMALLMVVLALYMFGLFSLGIPASVSSGKSSGGFSGSVGMGFLAAVLSTPCSFAILTFVLAWAQTQPIPLATITILLIGFGMATPYVILTMMPNLLAKIPKPGRWMELFKHATGFVLLAIAVKLVEAVPSDRVINILYYAIILTVCVWMWGVCVSYDTPQAKKWSIRFIAVLLGIIFAFALLTAPQKGLIDWQPYDYQEIEKAEKNKQPVLIDFTAEWCLSCKVLDKTVYSDKKVAELLKQKGVLTIKADTTSFDLPGTKALKEIYNEPGTVPVSVLLIPGKEPLKLRGNLIKTDLINNLNDLTDAKK